MTLYRVIVRVTDAVQSDGHTNWINNVLYCGPDRLSARTAYHTSMPSDYWSGEGEPACETILEYIEDANSGHFGDDLVKPASSEYEFT